MTDKKLKINQVYTELSIQIAVLDAKLDKLIELAMQDFTIDYCEDTHNKVEVIIESLKFDEEFK